MHILLRHLQQLPIVPNDSPLFLSFLSFLSSFGLQMKNLETELERRTVTYIVWNQSTTKTDNGGWHPFTFSYADAGSQQIKNNKGLHISSHTSCSLSLFVYYCCLVYLFGHLYILCAFSGYQPRLL